MFPPVLASLIPFVIGLLAPQETRLPLVMGVPPISRERSPACSSVRAARSWAAPRQAVSWPTTPVHPKSLYAGFSTLVIPWYSY